MRHLCIRNGPSEAPDGRHDGYLNMPSSQKRARSPDVDGRPSKRRCEPVQIHQNSPLKRTRWRGPKDNRLKALQKLERKRRSAVFKYTPNIPFTSTALQLNARVRHTTPAPGESPLQNSPGHAVPHSPPSLPADVEYGELEGFNDFTVSPHVPLGSGLCTTSSVRNNRALFRQTRHLDNHTPAWNQRRNNQATQWKLVAIPQLIPIYLANRAATESGRLPPPPLPNFQCQCDKVALKIEMVTWDREFSLHFP